jgi:uncharacterized RDD family membrane protein YckC
VPISAPLWRRLAALLYDGFILLALSFFYGAVITLIGALAGWHQGEYQPMFHHWIVFVGWVLTLIAFYCWFWHKSGQTVGMRAWRLKLVSQFDNSQTPNWQQCLVRSLVAIPSVLLGGIGYWCSFFDTQKRSLHDRISRTQVLLTEKEK